MRRGGDKRESRRNSRGSQASAITTASATSLDDLNGSYYNGNKSISEPETTTRDIITYPTTQTVFYIEYITIFIMGIFGNCLVCYVVLRNKHMQTVTNYFITNLAVADILLCAVAVPFTPLYTFMGEWLFGQVLCQLLPMTQGTSVYVSSLTLMSIAIDRYFVIIYPFRPRIKLQTCYIIIFFIWLFSIGATLPYAFYMSIMSYGGTYYCEEKWPSETVRHIFSLFTSIMQFVVPFFIILFCYVVISVRMNQRVRSKPGAKNIKKEEADRERKRRTHRMLISMVSIFALCWLPMNVIHLIGDYYAPSTNWQYYNLGFFITHVVAMSSTCYNPFLYAWLNDNFRKEFQLVLPCFQQSASSGHLGHHGRSERTCNGADNSTDRLLRLGRNKKVPKPVINSLLIAEDTHDLNSPGDVTPNTQTTTFIELTEATNGGST
ncbi:unnamed protein product, partial [Meganyctiphanes norvegica]